MANEENIIPHQFTSSQDREEAAKNGRKGGVASGIVRRRKGASRKYLKALLAIHPKLTANDERMLEKAGVELSDDIDNEYLITLAMLLRARAGDLRAIDMVHEYLGEDPRTMFEEKRLKVQQEAVSALKGSDGFMEAIGGVVEEVFESGGDTPDTLEDSE